MSAHAPYHIQDEPRPGALGHLVVNPLWPLLATMFVGPWLSLPWFLLNGLALGSPTRRTELLLALAYVPGMLGILFVLGQLNRLALLPDAALSYAFVLLVVWRLTLGYLLFNLQQRGFALHEYFGGVVRNGVAVLAAGVLLGTRVVERLVDGHSMLRVLLLG